MYLYMIINLKYDVNFIIANADTPYKVIYNNYKR